jgi:hypothetical protein
MSQIKRNVGVNKLLSYLAINDHQRRKLRIKEPRRTDVKKSVIFPHMQKTHT